MINRRTLLAAPALLLPAATQAAGGQSFEAFVAEVKAEARRKGMKPAVLDHAFRGVSVNNRVIELDRKQPEFTLTWEQYKGKVISDTRIAKGRALYAKHRKLLDAICAKYGLVPGPLMGIWGLESNYGESSGGFKVVESLATLAWEGRRAKYFRSELLDALKILDSGDVPPERMIGSYAGAMGQPQFMPDSYLHLAVDWDGDGHRDIWGSVPDVLASIANYLAKTGWSGPDYAGRGWGGAVSLPPGFDAAQTGHKMLRTMGEWTAMGVRLDGAQMLSRKAAVILPGGPGSEAFLYYAGPLKAVRDYNPSDYYSISVNLIGDAIVGA
jgi:membrane-bound lytic murein transglycosylase B